MVNARIAVLDALNVAADGIISSSLDLAVQLNIDHTAVVGLLNSILGIPDVINVKASVKETLGLTKEGEEMACNGSAEYLVFNAIPANDEGALWTDVAAAVGKKVADVGLMKAMSKKWLTFDKKAEGGPRVTRRAETVEDEVQAQLKYVAEHGSAVSTSVNADLKKRKLIQIKKVTHYCISKGSNFTTELKAPVADLTSAMLLSGEWKDASFKTYNFNAMGQDPTAGFLHPLMKVRAEYRAIFLEMGFEEMPTNNFIESSFWNFDTLFQPQQHPARDAHDTFFMKTPELSTQFPHEYLERVKATHECGGDTGSVGYQVDWKIEEAQKNILRTHTTAVSSRMLYKLAQLPTFSPVKYFSIDRVFRNEALDATHLAEFHQIEGLVADYNLTLGDLMGTIEQFFKKIGIKKLRFKPAYNPYTEPSMEVFSFHEGLNKWVEIGNSGVFRPEMLLPMGLPSNVRVIAWGLSLERPTMIKYGIKNIRELIGHKINLDMVQKNPLCRLDKD